MVNVIEVDVVCTQSLEAVFDRVHNAHPRHPRVVGARAHGVEELGGNDRVAAAALERLASDDLGLATAIRIGCVEEIDARVKRQIDDPLGLPLVGAVAKGHGAKANFRYFEAGAAHSAIFHSFNS